MIPGVKLTKTLDNRTILIEIENSGWKFSTNCETINIENGIYFGKKNLKLENQNICISGKIDKVDQSTSRLKEASGIYFASYTGMDVKQATELRKLCRETNVDYSITKNTLIKIAAKNAGYDNQFDDLLKGQIAIATSVDDPVAPARIIKNFNKDNNDVLEVVGVF